MAKGKIHNRALPRNILENTMWNFGGSPFPDRATFDSAVRVYQLRILGQDAWQPDEIVLPCPRVLVAYPCFQNDEEVESTVELLSDNGASFTASELLFKVHNAVCTAEMGDHCFFEGFSLSRPPAAGETPRYILELGS